MKQAPTCTMVFKPVLWRIGFVKWFFWTMLLVWPCMLVGVMWQWSQEFANFDRSWLFCLFALLLALVPAIRTIAFFKGHETYVDSERIKISKNGVVIFEADWTTVRIMKSGAGAVKYLLIDGQGNTAEIPHYVHYARTEDSTELREVIYALVEYKLAPGVRERHRRAGWYWTVVFAIGCVGLTFFFDPTNSLQQDFELPFNWENAWVTIMTLVATILTMAGLIGAVIMFMTGYGTDKSLFKSKDGLKEHLAFLHAQDMTPVPVEFTPGKSYSYNSPKYLKENAKLGSYAVLFVSAPILLFMPVLVVFQEKMATGWLCPLGVFFLAVMVVTYKNMMRESRLSRSIFDTVTFHEDKIEVERKGQSKSYPHELLSKSKRDPLKVENHIGAWWEVYGTKDSWYVMDRRFLVETEPTQSERRESP